MYTFGQLYIGDLFNTKAARWVKISSHEALSVMSGCFASGAICRMTATQEVVVLWSNNPAIKSASASERESVQHASCSESEKEDRFYRKIEAEIDAENRAKQAAEFKQSLIDELAALKLRRIAMVPYLETLNPKGIDYRLAKQQEDAMVEYIDALYRRISQLELPAKQNVYGTG